MPNRLSVVYTDGTSEDIPIRPIGVVAAERHFGGLSGHTAEATFYAAWFVKGRPSGSFDAWLETVEDGEEKTADPRPLAQEPSPEESQT